ncbi:MAG TPA: ribosome maturation factor RimM [Ottowia sp.]|uniref:ribosome maturation factor RimM n=1 Tax=Ottowia sp. TaxID=1898956 RepID=UPI002B757E99|nr:ribosome maturation factor RimM [Ottowia sp.]HMN21891.1 ribosome maturation factor RimM [Ottowia sp.]
MEPLPEPASLPADAVEVGRVRGAWGIRGWFSVQPYSASPEALFSARRWYLEPSERGARPGFPEAVALDIAQARAHGDGLVAKAQQVDDRDAAEALKGARIFVARADFPPLPEDEYYWVDLIGLAVVNREGLQLGEVVDLLATGPQQTLVLQQLVAGKTVERLIPFVSAYVDAVDLQERRIRVDWQPDY